nr:hypothetical protein CFP56_62521 [Quercus suber]
MPLELGMMEEEDIPAWSLIDALSMGHWNVMQAMNRIDLKGQPREVMVEEYTRANFTPKDENVWLKVTDTETGQTIAGAFWRVREHTPPAPQGLEEPPAPAENAGADPKTEELSVMGAMAPISKAFMDEHVRGRPHLYLQILATHPDHQRRGAGDLLVKWGCDEADRRGLLCCMMSSDVAWQLYERNGFAVMTRVEMDLRPFGIEGVDIRRAGLSCLQFRAQRVTSENLESRISAPDRLHFLNMQEECVGTKSAEDCRVSVSSDLVRRAPLVNSVAVMPRASHGFRRYVFASLPTRIGPGDKDWNVRSAPSVPLRSLQSCSVVGSVGPSLHRGWIVGDHAVHGVQ